MIKLTPWKSIFREFAHKSNEDEFIEIHEKDLVDYFKKNHLYKQGGKGPRIAIEQYAKKKKVNLKGLDLKYIVDNIYWG
jgi:hypothetical protein